MSIPSPLTDQFANKLAVLPQYLFPKQWVTELAGHLASRQAGSLTTQAIEWFIRRYGVNMAEAANPDPASYATFNAFFTRQLQAGARPLADTTWVSPVDGAISQLGRIETDAILQAKGQHYSVASLLGGDEEAALPYHNGHFACLYLSPKDYHRIHMPCAGTLTQMTHVPGSLFSVNPTTARGVPSLFARNERVVCHFDTAYGPMVLVLVGATIVGSMLTSWHGVVNSQRSGDVSHWLYPEAAASGEPIRLAQGQEMGQFQLGSTVVMLWPQSTKLRFAPDWRPEAPIRMGQAMAQVQV